MKLLSGMEPGLMSGLGLQACLADPLASGGRWALLLIAHKAGIL